VERFSIGFGPKMVGFTRGDTEYRVSWFPVFGGYVKFAGDNPAEEQKEEEGQFLSAPVSHRAIVALSGPGMNMVSAVFAIALAYMVGLSPPPSNMVGYVHPDSPASEAGIAPSDKILSVDGYKVRNFNDIKENVFINPNEEIEITLLRDEDEEITVKVTPTSERREILVLDIGLEFQSDLDNGTISEDLRQKLRDNGISLSQDATVLVEAAGKRWSIADKDKRYPIKKEIALSPYGPPVDADSVSSIPQSVSAGVSVVTVTVRRGGDTIEVPFALRSEDRLMVYWEMEDIMIGIGSFSKPIIGHVEPGSVAAEAGFRSDDIIEAVNHNKIGSTTEFINELQDTFGKDSQLISSGGFSFGKVASLNPIAAFRMAIPETIRLGGKIFQWLKRMIIGEVSADKIAGPVGMIQITMVVLKTGVARTLWFAGFLSVNLGIVNLLPLFITDGAVIVFLMVEKLRGKPMNRKRQLLIQQIGIAFIILLFLLLTYNDILRWISGGF
jgi:regulator of sigma E protease